MLEDCLVESRPSARKSPLTLVLSVLTHGTIVGALVLIPLFQDQLLPQIPALAPMRPPEVAVRTVELPRVHQSSRSAAPPPTTDALFAPALIPKDIAIVIDEPLSGPAGFLPNSGGGVNGPSLPFSLIGPTGGPAATPPPPPPRPVPPPAPPRAAQPEPELMAPVPRGGDVIMSNLIHQVTPAYPSLARTVRAQGAVLLEAVITREGAIDPARLRVVSGHALLTQAAVDAVKLWRYRPTLLNGKPVEVITTITINFTLN